MHELVHYGRYWNGESLYLEGKWEAGATFELNSFGKVHNLENITNSAKQNGWKF